MSSIRVPASTANLGPGFDALGMALTLYAEIGLLDGRGATGDPPPTARVADDHHPATLAFEAAGGTGTLWVSSPIPAGRGLGFSGAVRVGGAALAVARDVAFDPRAFERQRARALPFAAAAEGHADNAAASLFGGIVAVAGSTTARVPTSLRPDVVVWIPAATTSTAASRGSLTHDVSFDDAVFNVGRVAVLVAALASSDIGALAAATADRLHQPARFADATESRAALAAGLAAGAWCGWLSGSGPTVALLCEPGGGDGLAAAVMSAGPSDAHTKVLAIDHDGAVLSP